MSQPHRRYSAVGRWRQRAPESGGSLVTAAGRHHIEPREGVAARLGKRRHAASAQRIVRQSETAKATGHKVALALQASRQRSRACRCDAAALQFQNAKQRVAAQRLAKRNGSHITQAVARRVVAAQLRTQIQVLKSTPIICKYDGKRCCVIVIDQVHPQAEHLQTGVPMQPDCATRRNYPTQSVAAVTRGARTFDLASLSAPRSSSSRTTTRWPYSAA